MSAMKSLIKAFIFSFLLAGVVSVLVGGTLYARVGGTTVDLNQLKIEPSPTQIFDKNGEIIATFKKDRKDVTKFEEIPNEIIQAVVSTEDRDFMQHFGINVKGIARALITDVKAKGAKQGGSTITQQLVKQVYVGDEPSMKRKIDEAVFALALEKEMSKKDILTNYLNHVDFGYQSEGIRNAVETYFGMSLNDFDKLPRLDRITKAALLGGIVQAPTALDPYYHPDAAMKRRNTVLNNMFVTGYITKNEYEESIKKDFMVLKKPSRVHADEKIYYEEFVHYVLAEAAIKLGYSKTTLDQVTEDEIKQAMYSGKKFYTSFDPKIYKVIRSSFARDDLFPQSASDGKKVQGSAVYVNPQNGEIYALTGSREQVNSFLLFNRAFQGRRQPGSSFKPIIAYGPALEYGLFDPWSSLVANAGHVFPGGYQVRDHGNVPYRTMLNAITNSNNVPAVWTLQQVGIKRARAYAERLGIHLTDKDVYLPIALGGIDKGVTALEMADAYQAYSNGGYRIPAHTIRRIVDRKENVIYEAPNQITDKDRVIKESTASDMKMMLRNVVTKGTGKNANIKGQMISGKTGTTEFGDTGGNKDVWFVGFTKQYVGALWMGYDSTDNRHYLTDYSSVPAKMFGEIATKLKDTMPDPDSQYKPPQEPAPLTKLLKMSGTYDSGNREINLEWESLPGVNYRIIRNGQVLADQTQLTKYTDKDVKNGQKYAYQVLGFNAKTNQKDWESDIASIDIPKFAAPTIQASEPSESAVTITWFSEGGVKEYTLLKDGKQIYQGADNSFTDDKLLPGASYKYQVTAKDDTGESAAGIVEVTTKEASASQSPPPDPTASDTNPPTETPQEQTQSGVK